MMDRQLKQRVVGAGLLVAFGVIFIPIFLDNGGVESPVPASMNIPPAPTEDVSQRAPALGEEAIAEMESQADQDVELPPSRVQAGEGSSAEPTPVAMPSESGEPPLAVETLEDGVVVDGTAPLIEEQVTAPPPAPRMQPPTSRLVDEPLSAAKPLTHLQPKPERHSKAAVKQSAAQATASATVPKSTVKSVETKVDPKSAIVAKPAEAKPLPATKAALPAVGGWTVQLGSFASDINAKKLVDRLKAAGYQAYTEPRLEHGATVFKVRVGPTPGKAEAERLRQRIEAQFEARGMLVPSR